MNLLPYEIHYIILEHINYTHCRSINKHFKDVADRIEANKNTCPISNIELYLDACPENIQYFTLNISVHSKSPLGFIKFTKTVSTQITMSISE